MNYYVSSRRSWKCSDPKCGHEFRVTQGTVFESSRIPLRKWFKAIYYFATVKRGLSSCQMSKLLSIEQKSAWFMCMRLREALRGEPDKILRGLIEVDETYISPDPGRDRRVQAAKRLHEKEQDEKYGFSPKRKTTVRKRLRKQGDVQKLKEFNAQQLALSKNGKRTPFRPATAVLGMLQRNGDVVLHHLGLQYLDTTKDNISPYLLRNIDLNSEIITDQSSFYTEVGKKFKNHRVVNHDVHFVSKEGDHTNGLENCWSHVARTLFGTFFHVSSHHFYRYLNEHSFRWNVKQESLREQCDDYLKLVFGKRLSLVELNPKKKAA